ncbi:sodium-dependent organic anion transporter-like [Watersipora subatra]|uniref:sodium-dependent organic anion transporter-like n=1 Tax=Watersipora subatra TaxID=2589382 RepID=UPI00355AF74B
MYRLLIVCLCLTQLTRTKEEQLLISPVRSGAIEITTEITTIAEGTKQILDFRFIHCSENHTERNLKLSLKRGLSKNLRYPEVVANVPCLSNDSTQSGSNATIAGKMLGFVTLQVEDDQTHELYLDYSVGITRPPPKLQDMVYIYGLIVLVALSTFTFGISLELEKVKKYIRRPIAPGIGVACQFMIMPLIGFAITVAMTDAHEALKLGIFASAAAPGGGLSNIFCYVLNGDLDLSITMTFVSNIAALGFLPIWMYTLGSYIIGGAGVAIPFGNVVQALALLVFPLAIGIPINHYLPKFAKKLLALQKITILITTIFIVVFGTWVNVYAFPMVFADTRLTISSILLPYIGGLFGFLIGLACQQRKEIAMTIGIETAVQSLNISIIILRTSLPQPWADISSAIPIVIGMCVFAPFPFLATARLIYDKLIKEKKHDKKRSKGEPEHEKKQEQSSGNLQNQTKEGIDNPITIKDEGLEEESETL